jgi:replicative DNA helicase
VSLTNIESEYLLIAAMVYDARRVDGIADVLAPTDFADPFFGRIFGLLVDHHGRGHALNAMTLRPHIEHDPSFAELGGNRFLADITSAASAVTDTSIAAKQIAELARRRVLVEGLTAAVALAQNINEPIISVVSAADGAMATATESSSAVNEVTGAKAIEALLANAGKPTRSVTSSNLPALDELIGGMRPKQVIIGAGRPGMGKTAAALSYALGAAKRGHGVLFVSLEMSATELAARMTADLGYDGKSGASYSDINADDPSMLARQAMGDAMVEMDDLPFHIVDAGSLTLGRLDMIVRRYRRRLAARGQSLDLVVVDYLQLLRPDQKMQSNYEAVSEISRRLKAMAKDNDVAVFALAQLSRDVEKRPDKRPVLSDLRDSGQIEQDADAVVFLYRHEYYLAQEKPSDEGLLVKWENTMADAAGRIKFICAKRRNGRTGSANGQFHGAYQAVRG